LAANGTLTGGGQGGVSYGAAAPMNTGLSRGGILGGDGYAIVPYTPHSLYRVLVAAGEGGKAIDGASFVTYTKKGTIKGAEVN
jgi:hypothetical protein